LGLNVQENSHWLDYPKTPRNLWILLIAVLFALIAAEGFISDHHQGIIASYGFYIWFGFLIGLGSIVLSKVFKSILKRKDTYYDD